MVSKKKEIAINQEVKLLYDSKTISDGMEEGVSSISHGGPKRRRKGEEGKLCKCECFYNIFGFPFLFK